jgi:hypothetical protein
VLTPTDIHYLVGLLSLAAHAENVELELGDFVRDEASESRRDVDVTITARNPDGSRAAYMGIEVKAHGRPLDSTTVEGLAQKLNDMREITHRGIVSASGFTEPAIRKERYHGIDVYELKTWRPEERFDFFQCDPLPAVQEQYGWSGTPDVCINPSGHFSETEQTLVRENPTVLFPESPESNCPLTEFLRNTSLLAAKEAAAKKDPFPAPSAYEFPAEIIVRFSDVPYIENDHARLDISEIRFTGVIKRANENVPTVPKALFKLDDQTPIAGCHVSEFSNFGLVALMVTADRRLEVGLVPISDRNKQKIYRQKLRRRSE